MVNTTPKIQPIGIIHSPYLTTSETPRQGNDEQFTIEIYPEYEQGLQDIEGFSHVYLLYWLHLSKGYNLMVQPPLDTGKHGLFSTRSPHRPNPIGLSVVKILKHDKNKLYVTGLDVIEGTPVIDIKPYIKSLDCYPDSHSGWAENLLSKS